MNEPNQTGEIDHLELVKHTYTRIILKWSDQLPDSKDDRDFFIDGLNGLSRVVIAAERAKTERMLANNLGNLSESVGQILRMVTEPTQLHANVEPKYITTNHQVSYVEGEMDQGTTNVSYEDFMMKMEELDDKLT